MINFSANSILGIENEIKLICENARKNFRTNLNKAAEKYGVYEAVKHVDMVTKYKIVSSCVASRKRKAEVVIETFETPSFNHHQQLMRTNSTGSRTTIDDEELYPDTGYNQHHVNY